MLHAIVTVFAQAGELAAEHEEESKTTFYILGSVLAGWAVVLSAIGLTQPSFPGDANAQRAVMGISIALMAATIAAAVGVF